MGENAYVLGGASALISCKGFGRQKSGQKNLAEENLKALQTKTARLGKARLFIYVAS
jgi:hypothetical protein